MLSQFTTVDLFQHSKHCLHVWPECIPVRLLVSLISSLLGPFMQHNSVLPCSRGIVRCDKMMIMATFSHCSIRHSHGLEMIWRYQQLVGDTSRVIMTGPSPDHRPAEVVKISLHRAAAADCSPWWWLLLPCKQLVLANQQFVEINFPWICPGPGPCLWSAVHYGLSAFKFKSVNDFKYPLNCFWALSIHPSNIMRRLLKYYME